MSLAVLERLRSSQEELVRMLDRNDAAGIEAATAALADAVDAVRAVDGWRDDHALAATVASVAALLQGAQMRVNFLTDQVRRRGDALASLGGRFGPSTYQPLGK